MGELCGIAGWVGEVDADRETLRRMCDALSHRGPDDDGELILPGKVALGFRRLSVIDLQTGSQPIPNEDASVQVTCNGEIYNFRGLTNELESRGHAFRSRSDAETIVHLYEELGDRCIEQLQGMFAIALWDGRAERLLLARDRLGVKPLYWAPVSGGLLYASEPGAILASGLLASRPDPEAILRYLTLQYVPGPRTGFIGIRKLSPGERLIFEHGKARIERYWDLDFPAERDSRSDNEQLDGLDERLSEATRDRLVADVPLGAFLSGGIDSSLVVSYMAEHSTRVKTFSIGFREEGFSETEHARRVSQIYATEHEEQLLEPDMVPLIGETVRHAGEPFADSSAIPTLLLSAMTKRHVTVALSGDGGDEAFAGYLRYLVARTGDKVTGARMLAKAFERSHVASLLPSRMRNVERAISALARSGPERYAVMMSQFTPLAIDALCTPEFLAAAGAATSAWDETLVPPPLPGVDKYLALDTATYLPEDLLVKVDRMSMAHALEVRSPFLDYRVYELAAAMPERMKLRGLKTKWALRQLARRRGLPDDLVGRRKQGFGVPIAAWFRGELRGWLEDVLLDPHSAGRGYFRQPEIERMLVEHAEGRADNSVRLWNLAMLELWQRCWVDAA